jgi:ribonuclease HI
MELKAAIEGLEAVGLSQPVAVYTDSQYVRNGITDWMTNWKRNGWRTASRKAVKNQDLWEALDNARQARSVSWHWVRGHSGHPENERADALANRAIDDYLKDGERN